MSEHPNAEWCPICYGWQEIEQGGCPTDHYLDHHREWLLAQTYDVRNGRKVARSMSSPR